MRRCDRFYPQQWLLPLVIAIFLLVAGVVAYLAGSSWGQAFSANLLAELLVAVGVGVVIVAWLRRESEAREQRRRAMKAVSILRDELHTVRRHAKIVADKGVAPVHPIPMGGWKLISSGPLLDSVPSEFLGSLIKVYSSVQDVNAVAERLVELTLGVGQALDTTKATRERLHPYFLKMVNALLSSLDSLLPDLDEYISETEERST